MKEIRQKGINEEQNKSIYKVRINKLKILKNPHAFLSELKIIFSSKIWGQNKNSHLIIVINFAPIPLKKKISAMKLR